MTPVPQIQTAAARGARQRIAAADVLQRIMVLVAERADPLAALVAVTEEVAGLFEAGLAAVLVLGEGVDGRHVIVSARELRDDAESLFAQQTDDPDGWLHALRRRDFSFVSNSLRKMALPPGWSRRVPLGDIGRVLVVPLDASGSTMGALAIARARGTRPFVQSDIKLARSIASVVALSVGALIQGQELSRFFAASLDLLCMMDLDGRLHRLNPQWDHTLGYDPKDLEGTSLLDLVHLEDRPSTEAAFADLRQAGVAAQFVNRIRASDGSYRWMEWLARPGRNLIHASARDITRWLAGEQALRESEKRLQDLVLATGDWIWEVDAQGRYISCSERVRDVLGFLPEEVIGRTKFDFMTSDEALRLRPVFDRMTAYGIGCGGLINRNRHKDGHEVILLSSCVPIFDNSSTLIGFRGVDKDVTTVELLVGALRESEDRYRLIAENSNDVIAVLDIDTMVLEYVSPSVERLCGFAPEELVGRELDALLPPGARERAQLSTDAHRSAFEAGDPEARSYLIESEFRRKDGGTVPVELSVKLITDGNGQPYKHITLVRDITARKAAEQELRDSEARYRLIGDSVADVIWVLDLKTLRFTYVSPSVERLRGYNVTEALAQSMEESLTPESYQRGLATLREALANVKEGEFPVVEGMEIDQPCKNGSIVNTEVSTKLLPGPDGKPAQILGVSRDVTRRRAAEEALRVSQKRLEDLIFVVGDWIWETDATYHYTQCSDGVRRVLGYEPEEILGLTPHDLMPEDEATVLRAKAKERLARVEGCQELVNRNLHRDGHEVILQTSSVPIFGTSGELVGFRGIDKDITSATKAQESLRATVVELNALWQIAETVAGQGDLDEALRSVTKLIVDALEAQFAFVLTFADGGEEERVVASDTEEAARYEDLFLQRRTGHLTDLARIAGKGEPVVINDLAAGPVPARMAERAQSFGFCRLLIVPLVLQTKAIGALVVARGEGSPLYSYREVEFAQAAAGTVAAAVVHTRLRAEENLKTASQVREHLARELHDAVTQSVYSASLIAQALPTIWQRDQAEGLASLGQLQRLVRSALAELRILLYELRPATLAGVGLDQLLERLADSLAGQSDLTVRVESRIEHQLPPDVKVAMYRIAQEAFNNIAKHANAHSVLASVVSNDGGALLEVKDDGSGVDIDAVGGDHMGLSIMRERAQEVGAEFEIRGVDPAGTQVSVRWIRSAGAG
jgi:PAS domain S-box-containing protein